MAEPTLTPTQLRAIRRRLGLTQAALAQALGVSRQTVSDWERGRVPLSQRTVLAVRALEQVKGDF